VTLRGQVEQELPDGRRLLSAVRTVEDGARAVLLLAPGRFRIDATPGEDMFRMSVRPLDPGTPVTSRSPGRPQSRLTAEGIDALDLPLVGAATLSVDAAGERYAVQVGTLRDAARGTTTFTVQAVVGPADGASPGAPQASES
jgi:hypothetical protein